MWMLNRNNRYEIIKKLIKNASIEQINEIIVNFGFKCYQNNDDIEYRRKELLEYLDEMNKCWNKHNFDLTDRQYIKVVDTSNETEENAQKPSKVCVIFKDEKEEQIFSKIASDINYRNNNSEENNVLKKKL